MPCEFCLKFPTPTSNFEEIGISIERHGTLYKCKKCGTFIELIAEEKSIRFTPIEDLKRYYKNVFKKSNKL